MPPEIGSEFLYWMGLVSGSVRAAGCIALAVMFFHFRNISMYPRTCASLVAVFVVFTIVVVVRLIGTINHKLWFLLSYADILVASVMVVSCLAIYFDINRDPLTELRNAAHERT